MLILIIVNPTRNDRTHPNVWSPVLVLLAPSRLNGPTKLAGVFTGAFLEIAVLDVTNAISVNQSNKSTLFQF